MYTANQVSSITNRFSSHVTGRTWQRLPDSRKMEPGTPGESGAADHLTGSHDSATLESTELGRKPKRVIHCSDGVVEEYSTDEEDEQDAGPVVDPQTLLWGPYMLYYTHLAALKTFYACEYLGEKLAYFFGITSPKYQYAITEYQRLEEEEREQLRMKEEDRNRIRDEIAEKEARKQNSRRAAAMQMPASI